MVDTVQKEGARCGRGASLGEDGEPSTGHEGEQVLGAGVGWGFQLSDTLLVKNNNTRITT